MSDHVHQQKEKLLDFYRSRRRMPSYAELAKIFGYKTKSAVSYAVSRLIEAGYISKDKSGRIIPKDLKSDIKILGLIQAGFPSPSEEELVDTMSLDDYLIKNKEATYILKVKGDSMVDAGIYEGDMVLVERGKSPKLGDIVVAQVDGEYTLKFFRQKNKQIYLEAANPKYKAIFPTNELKIEAVVKAVIRQY